jgi:D-arabinose 1-dehydrogenase-like Zn-dependent alcohol dehydrogenase
LTAYGQLFDPTFTLPVIGDWLVYEAASEMIAWAALGSIAVSLASHVGRVRAAQLLAEEGLGTREIAKRLGLRSEFPARKALAHSENYSREELDAAIIFAPVGALVPAALRAVARGGTVVCAGIHMSDIPSFSYDLLWEERSVRSVANLTRQDGLDFLALAPEVPVRTEVMPFPLEAANEALEALRGGRVRGAAVLVVDAC